MSRSGLTPALLILCAKTQYTLSWSIKRRWKNWDYNLTKLFFFSEFHIRLRIHTQLTDQWHHQSQYGSLRPLQTYWSDEKEHLLMHQNVPKRNRKTTSKIQVFSYMNITEKQRNTYIANKDSSRIRATFGLTCSIWSSSYKGKKEQKLPLIIKGGLKSKETWKI